MNSIEAVRKLLTGNPRDERVLHAFGDILSQGSRREALQLWSRGITENQKSKAWLQEVITQAMQSDLLQCAGPAAELYALLRWGGQDHAELRDNNVEAPSEWPAQPFLTHPKLRHDIEQFGYLSKNPDLDQALLLDLMARYEGADARLRQRGGGRQPLDEKDQEQIGRY